MPSFGRTLFTQEKYEIENNMTSTAYLTHLIVRVFKNKYYKELNNHIKIGRFYQPKYDCLEKKYIRSKRPDEVMTKNA